MKHAIFLSVLALLIVPVPALAQFGPIVPAVCQVCACGFGGVLAIIQNLFNLVIGLAAIIATLIIVWAGGLYIMSPTNPEMRSQANHMLINAFIGILIVLSAWLIVDFVMKTLYGGQFGPWNSILVTGSGPGCVQATDPKPLGNGGSLFEVPGNTPDTGTGGGTGANCPAADPATMVAFPAAATSGGSEKATKGTVDNFMAMRTAALKDGVDLKVVDGYRSDAEQVQLWNQYNQDTRQVAKPCSLGGGGSNHNSGTAVDINIGCSKTNSSCNTAAYQWLKKNGGAYGFRNALSDDVIHWSPSGR